MDRIVKLEMDLPESLFDCYESSYITRIHFEIKRRVQNQKVVTGQLEAMGYLTEEVHKAMECCTGTTNFKSECVTCAWLKSDIKDYFKLHGFDTTKTMFSGIQQMDSLDCVCDNDYSSTFTSICEGINCIEVQTNLSDVEIIGLSTSIDEIKEEFRIMAEIYDINGIDFYGCITDNSIFCEDLVALKGANTGKSLSDYETSFNTSTVGIWIHLQAISDYEVEAYVKVKGNQGRALYSCSEGVYPNIDCVHTDCSYCDRLQWVFNKLGEYSNMYSQTLNLYKKSLYDILFVAWEENENSDESATTTALTTLLDNNIFTVTINLNNLDMLSEEKFCYSDLEKRGYLKAAETILHECFHAKCNYFLLKTDGSVADRYRFTSHMHLNDGCRFLQENYPVSYHPEVDPNFVEHHIIHKYYTKTLANELRVHNLNYGNIEDYGHYFFYIGLSILTYDTPEWIVNQYLQQFNLSVEEITNRENESELAGKRLYDYFLLKKANLENQQILPCQELD